MLILLALTAQVVLSNPADTSMQTVSRTVGPDRVVGSLFLLPMFFHTKTTSPDEFILRMTHDRTVDWLLPKVPPTGKKIAVPMLGVINVRGDRLYHGTSSHSIPLPPCSYPVVI